MDGESMRILEWVCYGSLGLMRQGMFMLPGPSITSSLNPLLELKHKYASTELRKAWLEAERLYAPIAMFIFPPLEHLDWSALLNLTHLFHSLDIMFPSLKHNWLWLKKNIFRCNNEGLFAYYLFIGLFGRVPFYYFSSSSHLNFKNIILQAN